MKKCPKCEKLMSDNSSFCDNCGTSLEGVETDTEILDNIQTVSTIPEEQTEELDPIEETTPETVPETEAETVPETEPETVPETEAETVPETEPETVPETEAETIPETVPETKPPKKSKKAKKENEPETVPETTVETVPETEPETVPETTVPETEPETVPETAAETVPETEPETVPETAAATVPETVPETTVETEPATMVETIPETVPVTVVETIPETQPVTIPVIVPETQPVVIPMPSPQPQTVAVPMKATQAIPIQQPEIEQPEEEDENDMRATVSLVLGITSLVLCGFLPIAGVGLLMAILASDKSKQKIPALILNIISIVIGIIALIIFVRFVSTAKDVDTGGKVFYGDGYILRYDTSWKATMMDEDRIALKYNGEESYFIQVGQSNLDETIECDFQKASCKATMYNDFYTYWKEDIDENLGLIKDSSFIHLKDDIYYATYNYSLKKTGEIKGKYYLIVSKEKNSVLSFVSNVSEDELATLNPAILDLLQTIEIDKQVSQEESMGQTLEKLSSWNQYSDLRKDALGRKNTIYGEFRILSDSSSYWVFKNGEFWWYKSEKDLKDNYWYGKMTVKTGKNGMKLVGLEESKLEAILDQSNGKLSSSDVYAIKMTPKKIISGGEDKSDTNIPEGTEWKFVWILVDHGDEGIEAQVVNVDTADTSYFVKVKD